MRIVVDHLTRMQPGYLCVAGIDLDTGRHVRPVLRGARLDTGFLLRKGGPFDIGAVVELAGVTRVGAPPETEDCLFNVRRSAYRENMEPDGFWRVLKSMSRDKLKDIFGDALKQHGQNCAVGVGTGRVSLGCLVPSVRPVLVIDMFGKVRLNLSGGRVRLSLPVTDLRLYEEDHYTPRRQRVVAVASRLHSGTEVILSVGLARAWQRPGDSAPRHWLQVNNIHLADDPLWQESRS